MQENFLHQELQDLRATLLAHPVFAAIRSQDDLKVFMEAHVFAVWDFMSLVKRLQKELSCLSVPWLPGPDPQATRLLHEIVMAEESDSDGRGGFISHFELYLEAMRDMQASTQMIEDFITGLRGEVPRERLWRELGVPAHVREFVEDTLTTAISGETEAVLGSFFFGREDLIPPMFRALLQSWGISASAAPRLHYYLERHIHLDGDSHGPAGQTLLARWTKGDTTKESAVLQASCQALMARIRLWDGVYADLKAASS